MSGTATWAMALKHERRNSLGTALQNATFYIHYTVLLPLSAHREECHSSISFLVFRLFSVTPEITLTRPDPLRRWSDCGLLGRIAGYECSPSLRCWQQGIALDLGCQILTGCSLIINCAYGFCETRINYATRDEDMYCNYTDLSCS